MKSNLLRRFTSALAAILVFMGIVCAAGCDVPGPGAGGYETPAPSPSETVPIISAELSPTDAVSTEPAETPTPKPTPLVYIDLDNKVPEQAHEADRICQAYLNAEGEFTSDALSETGLYVPQNYNKKEEFYLGTLEVSNGGFVIAVQEVLLFTVKLNDRFFLICGAEDKDKKRFINPVEVPIDIITDQNDHQTCFYISTKSNQLCGMLEPDGTYWTNQLASKDMQEIIEGCSGYLKRPIFFHIYGRKQEPDSPAGPPKAFATAANKRLRIARNFAASVYIPDYNRALFIKYLKKVGKITGDPVTINTIDELYKADLDKTLLITGFIAYKK